MHFIKYISIGLIASDLINSKDLDIGVPQK